MTRDKMLDDFCTWFGFEDERTIVFASMCEDPAITDEFLEAISKNEKICPHFHLSLQSAFS